MNLIQQANFLENVPKDQLAQMSQDPNGQFPPFLVLTEIQRRTMNEQNYKAMQEQPTTTVAEEVVSEFMQPQLAQNQSQGLQGGVPEATPLPTNISAGLSGAPTAPMQMAASGGITGFANTGTTSLDYRYPTLPDMSNLDQFSVSQDLSLYDQSGGNTQPLNLAQEIELDNAQNQITENLNLTSPENVNNNITSNVDPKFPSFLNQAENLKSDKSENENLDEAQGWFQRKYTMEDGSIDYATAAIDGFDVATTGLLVFGVAGLGAKGLLTLSSLAARKALMALRSPVVRQKIKNAATKTKNFLFTKPNPIAGANLLPRTLSSGRAAEVATAPARLFSPARTAVTTGVGLKGLQGGYDYMTSPSSPVVKPPETTKGIYQQALEDAIANNPNSGLFSDESEGSGQMDYRDMIRMGTGIMGAKNMSELGESVAGTLDAQEKRELLGLQGKFTQAQTDQIRANIEAMPLQEKLAVLKELGDTLKLILSGEIQVTDEEKTSYILKQKLLTDEIIEMQGLASSGTSALNSDQQKVRDQYAVA